MQYLMMKWDVGRRSGDLMHDDFRRVWCVSMRTVDSQIALFGWHAWILVRLNRRVESLSVAKHGRLVWMEMRRRTRGMPYSFDGSELLRLAGSTLHWWMGAENALLEIAPAGVVGYRL